MAVSFLSVGVPQTFHISSSWSTPLLRLERRVPQQKLSKDTAYRPDVNRVLVLGLSQEQLGRPVPEGDDSVRVPPVLTGGKAREPEVGQLERIGRFGLFPKK